MSFGQKRHQQCTGRNCSFNLSKFAPHTSQSSQDKMPLPSRNYSNDGGEADERQEQKRGPMTEEQDREGRTLSPISRRRRGLSGGSRKSPGRKSPGRSLTKSESLRRIESSSHHRKSTGLGEQQESSPQIRRGNSVGRQVNNSMTPARSLQKSQSLRRVGSGTRLRSNTALVEQGGTSQMRRNNSFGRQLNGSNSGTNLRRLGKQQRDENAGTPQTKQNHSFGKQQLNVSDHRRKSKSPVSQRRTLPAMNGSGASQTRDRTARRRMNSKQTTRRTSTATSGSGLGAAQINILQTLQRGLHSDKPSLEQSDVSESSDSMNVPAKPQVAASKDSESSKILVGESSAEDTTSSKRHTMPGLNKPNDESREPVKRSSDPVKLELGDGVKPRPTLNRRCSWWNLPSSADLGDLDEDDDDIPPAVVPPSRRRSLMMAHEEMTPEKSSSSSHSKPTSTPKQSKKAGKSSTGKKKSLRSNKSLDSLHSVLTNDTDAESGSWQADSNDVLQSPVMMIKKAPMDDVDLVSPLPSIPKMKRLDKQLSSGTCSTESSTGSGSSSAKKGSKERRPKKSKRKSVKEGTMNTTPTVKAEAEKEDLDGSMRGPIQVSLKDQTSHSMTSKSSEVSSHSRSSGTRRRLRRSKKEGSSKGSSVDVVEKEDLDGSISGPIQVSLNDHFNRPDNDKSFNRSLNRSIDLSSHSRSSTTKRSLRKSMSIKQNNMEASRSSMSVSLSDDQNVDFSIGSDFEGSADFDFEEEDLKNEEQPSGYGVEGVNAEDSFQVVGGDSKQHKDRRSRMKGKTRRSSGGGSSRSQSARMNKKSPIAASLEKGIVVMEM